MLTVDEPSTVISATVNAVLMSAVANVLVPLDVILPVTLPVKLPVTLPVTPPLAVMAPEAPIVVKEPAAAVLPPVSYTHLRAHETG